MDATLGVGTDARAGYNVSQCYLQMGMLQFHLVGRDLGEVEHSV